MKFSGLSGAELDYWVARAEGVPVRAMMNHANGSPDHFIADDHSFGNVKYSPSTCWEQGGPIIEREQIELRYEHGEWHWIMLQDQDGNVWSPAGPTMLIAGMRAYLVGKFGNDIPSAAEIGKQQPE